MRRGAPQEVAGNEDERISIHPVIGHPNTASVSTMIGLLLDDGYVAHRNSFESFTEHDVMALTSTL